MQTTENQIVSPNAPTQTVSDFAPYALTLLKKGVIYYNRKQPDDWNRLISFQKELKHYFGQIGIRALFDEKEGYVYLSQPQESDDDNDANALPRLIQRNPISYEVTLICALLRLRLEEFDVNDSTAEFATITRKAIEDEMEARLPATQDHAKLKGQIAKHIEKVREYGFLHLLQEEADGNANFEIKRMIKAKLTAEKAQEILSRLQQKAG